MKKIITILLLLICVSISFSQSKKQQIETLTYKLDSINSVLLRSIDDNEKLSDTKLVLESKISSLKKGNASKNGKINSLQYEINVQDDSMEILKISQDSLIKQLETAVKNQNKTSYVVYGDDDVLVPLDIESQIDFQFVYQNGNGFNPPIIYPIGLSYNGYFAYRVDHCDGMCGCCYSEIVIKNLNSNQILIREGVNLVEMGIQIESLWVDPDYYNSVYKIMKKYKIIPIGFGKYNTSNIIVKNNPYGKSNPLEIILETKEKSYELKTKTTENKVKLKYQGNLEYDEFIDSWSGVDYAGHFISHVNNYAVVALMHNSVGDEGVNDYKIEFIGIKLPD